MTCIHVHATIIFICSFLVHIAMTTNIGLVCTDGRSMQLLTIHTSALIEGPYAEIHHTHIYTNPYDVPLETQFYFPRTDTSIFHSFEAVLKDHVIVGEILEKKEAKQKYDWNVQLGNTVAYSERSEAAPDVMQVLVGNIPAGETVQIRFAVIEPLTTVANKFWGLTLPAVLTERYVPGSVDTSETPSIQTVDAEHSSAYKQWTVCVQIKTDSAFSHLLNPSHHIQPQLTETALATTSSQKIYTAVWNETLVPNKDFVVYFRTLTPYTLDTIVAEHPKYPAQLCGAAQLLA